MVDRDILSNPDVQRMLSRNGELWLDMERFLHEPTVVFSAYGADDFWTTVMNSSNKEKVIERVSTGEIIPLNGDLAGDIGQVHSIFHSMLYEAKVPIIPTAVNVQGNKVFMFNTLPKTIPNIWVKKISYKDGVWLSHGDNGVQVFQAPGEKIEEHYPEDHLEFLQPFIVPEGNFVRDIRIYTIGGRPVAGVVRRGQEPLRPENITGEVIPTHEQYPSAIFPGPKERLGGELRERTFSAAEKVIKVIDNRIRRSVRIYSQYSALGFASVDFLIDSNGNPLPVDFDTLGPSVAEFENIPEEVAEKLAEYLIALSVVGGVKRKVAIIGDPQTRILFLTLKNIQQRIGRDAARIIPDLVSRAEKEGYFQKI